MEIIKSLSNTSFDVISEAFFIAFKDYEMQLNKQELLTMINRRGFRKELSFGAFDGDRLVSFTLNGVGKYRGNIIAYDTGTGTIAEHQGKGLASRVFKYSIPYLHNANISEYLLEVLQHNSSAVSVYRKAGFRVSREFGYYVMSNKELRNNITKGKYEVEKLELPTVESLCNFFDFEPSWQNSFEAIKRDINSFIILGVRIGNGIGGFAIMEPNSGDITQLAVNPKFRRMGIATSLLNRMVHENKHAEIKMINTDLNCMAMDKFMNASGIKLSGKQFEMVRDIKDVM